MKNKPAIVAAVCFGIAIVLHIGTWIAVRNFIDVPIVPSYLAKVAFLVAGIVLSFKALKREKSPRTYSLVAVGLIYLAFLIFGWVKPIPFDKNKWNETERNHPVWRSGMLKDLMKNHLRTGMTHGEVVELLGDSVGVWYVVSSSNGSAQMILPDDKLQSQGKEFSMTYAVPMLRGEEIYPPISKILVVEFTKDKTVGDFRLKEWSPGDQLFYEARRGSADAVSGGEAEQSEETELPENAAAYLGKWKCADTSGMAPTTDDGSWIELTISANKLVWTDHNGHGFTLSGLKWEAVDEPTGNADYPTGYKITGRLDNVAIYALTKLSDSFVSAFVGEQAMNWWYISTDGQSLMMGLWIPPHNAHIDGGAFVKQP